MGRESRWRVALALPHRGRSIHQKKLFDGDMTAYSWFGAGVWWCACNFGLELIDGVEVWHIHALEYVDRDGGRFFMV